MKNNKHSIIAIDPGLREMGVCHFVGDDLIDYGVKSLRRPGNYNKRLNQVSLTIMRLLDEKKPNALVLEKNTFSQIQQNLPLVISIKCIHKLAKDRNIPIYEFAANTVKKAITGDGWATKRQVARVLCSIYPELAAYREANRRWRERYYMNMFDAVACGLTYIKLYEKDRL